MSLFRRALSSFGIGACRVDTLLEHDSYCAGDKLPARVMIYGGDVSQSIDGIYFSIHCSYRPSMDDKAFSQTSQLAHCQLSEPFTIEAGAEMMLPVVLTLPDYTPLSDPDTKVWLHTGLDIALAADPDDQDRIAITAEPRLARVLAELAALGWHHRGSVCESTHEGVLQQTLLLETDGPISTLLLRSRQRGAVNEDNTRREHEVLEVELALPDNESGALRQLMGRRRRSSRLSLDAQALADLPARLQQCLTQLRG